MNFYNKNVKKKIKYIKLNYGIKNFKSKMIRLKLGNKIIKEGSRPYIIAEAGINFDGKLSKCYKLIDKASKSGADAIKFQTHIAECEMIDTKVYLAHSKKETVYQLMKRCELSLRITKNF